MSESWRLGDEPATGSVSTGQRFGSLTAVVTASRDRGRASWACECDCGATVEIRHADLLNGSARSCGCANGSRVAEAADVLREWVTRG
jgi:hypothetical protein